MSGRFAGLKHCSRQLLAELNDDAPVDIVHSYPTVADQVLTEIQIIAVRCLKIQRVHESRDLTRLRRSTLDESYSKSPEGKQKQPSTEALQRETPSPKPTLTRRPAQMDRNVL